MKFDYNAIFDKIDQVKLYKLVETTNLEDIKDENLRELLITAYNSKDAAHRQMASLINATFTQHLKTFLLSKRIAAELFANDENTKLTTIDTKRYKTLLMKLLEGKSLKRLREPSGSQAGVYQWTDPNITSNLTEQMAKEFWTAQEKAVLDFYDVSMDNKDGEVKKIKQEIKKARKNNARKK
jgi:hypothetical protein